MTKTKCNVFYSRKHGCFIATPPQDKYLESQIAKGKTPEDAERSYNKKFGEKQ